MKKPKTKLPKYIMSQAIVSTRTRINNDNNNKCHIKDAFLAENQMKNKCKF